VLFQGGKALQRELSLAWNLVRDPSLAHVHLIDAYVNGALPEVPLKPLLATGFRLAQGSGLLRGLLRLTNRAQHARADSRREDIRHHYDLETPLAERKIDPTRFYQRLLGPSMSYSMAYWPPGTTTLEDAQRRKQSLYQSLLELRAGHQVFDAGCGFGSFRAFVEEKGARWHGATFSSCQAAWIRGLGGDVREQDLQAPWPDDAGRPRRFDRIVTLGALEHVQDLSACFASFRDKLTDDGRVLVHLITTTGDSDSYVDGWISRHIFPNGQFYRHEVVRRHARERFEIVDERVFPGRHYAQTLSCWAANFEAHLEELGAPPRFVRAWRFWLASSEAAFEVGMLQNSMLVLKPRPA
jgi:cyclopropane-fatty-acyl-phospholipid synthase